MDEKKKGLDAFSRLSSGRNQGPVQSTCKKCGEGINFFFLLINIKYFKSWFEIIYHKYIYIYIYNTYIIWYINF